MQIKWLRNFNLLTNFYKKRLVSLFVLMILAVLFEVLSIGSLLPLINYLVLGSNEKQYLFDYLPFLENFTQKEIYLYSTSIIFILFLLRHLFLFFYTKINANYIAYLSIYHEERILLNILNKDYNFLAKQNTSNFLREFQGEIKSITSQFVQPILTIALNFLTIISLIILLYVVNPQVTLYALAFSIVILIFFVIGFKKKFFDIGYQLRKQRLIFLNYVKQIFDGIRELKIYQREKVFIDDLKKPWFRQANIAVQKNVLLILPKIALELIVIVSILVSFYFISDPIKLIPTVSIFILSLIRIMPAITSITKCFQTIHSVQPVIDGLQIHFEENNKIGRIKNKEILFREKIEIKDVTFSFDQKSQIFEKLNLIIKKNTFIGIKGPNGSGKSTFVDILSGLINLQIGEIFVDSTKINKENKFDWISKIGYVQQKIFFFEESLEFNITLEKDSKRVDQNRLTEIINMMSLNNFFSERDIRLNGKIGESAKNISGGQAQRLGIARALYNANEIIIFDEAFNNLDKENLKKLLNIMKYLKQKSTVIMISHLDHTFIECDEVYEIKDKKLKKIK